MKPKYSCDLFGAISDLHSHATRSSDALYPADYTECVDFLKTRLQNWKPSFPQSSERFDSLLRELIVTVLEEVGEKG